MGAGGSRCCPKDEPVLTRTAPDHAYVVAPDAKWRAVGWVRSLNSVQTTVAEAIAPARQADPLEFLRGGTEQSLRTRLAEHGLAGIADDVCAAMTKLLCSEAPTGIMLNDKFCSDPSTFTMAFGDLTVFYGGLQKLVGLPRLHPTLRTVQAQMESEHCDRPDSMAPFTTNNGLSGTTSTIEWEFVVLPKADVAYAERESLRNTLHRREPKPLASFNPLIEKVNARLASKGQLVEYELIGGRLYTGPMCESPSPASTRCSILAQYVPADCACWLGRYEKYNAILRANSKVPFLVELRDKLCGNNEYTTTLHAVNSCVLKLSKLTKAVPVYRGFKGGTLPESFWQPREHEVAGGVEFGFMSTTSSREQAEAYAQGNASTLVKMEQGLVDRGAELHEISQYPHEREILFPPLTGMQMLGSCVEGKTLVLHLRLSVNFLAPTLDELVSRRRKLVADSCDNALDELDAEFKVGGWSLQRRLWTEMVPNQGNAFYVRARETLACTLAGLADKEPAFFNDDRNLFESMRRVVFAKAGLIGSMIAPTAPEKMGPLIDALIGSDFTALAAAEHVDLGKRGLGELGGAAIQVLLHSLLSCKRFHLENNNLGDAHVMAISTSLRDGALPALLDLRLQQNKIRVDGAKELATTMTAGHLTKLQEFRIWGNQLGDPGLTALAPGLVSLPSLKILSLGENDVSDIGVEALSAVASQFSSITRIDLSKNPRITDVGFASLKEVVPSCQLPR